MLAGLIASTTSFYPVDQFVAAPGTDPAGFEVWRSKFEWAEQPPPAWHRPTAAEVRGLTSWSPWSSINSTSWKHRFTLS